MPCDIIIVSGSCTVNKSNITGESDPIPKSIQILFTPSLHILIIIILFK